MAKIEVTKTELVWPGKYDEDKARREGGPWNRRSHAHRNEHWYPGQ